MSGAGYDQMLHALEIIGRNGCTRVVHKVRDFKNYCNENGRTLGAYFEDERWCDGCVANEALRKAGESP